MPGKWTDVFRRTNGINTQKIFLDLVTIGALYRKIKEEKPGKTPSRKARVKLYRCINEKKMQSNEVPNLLSFQTDIGQVTQLSHLCGSSDLFCDRYMIARQLGRGGFGVTFLARNMALPGQPWCVIKQLCPKVKNEGALKRARKCFKREAKTLAKLGAHGQIPQLRNYFEVDGEFYLVQDYIQGHTLTTEVRRHGPFSEESVKEFLREILPLLQFIHDQGVIHRDIKPPNIIRRRVDRKLVLIDFGAVKEEIAQSTIFGEQATAAATTTHFIGTMGFAPPEQLSLRPVYGSDIYALGMTCLYLLTGKTPMKLSGDSKIGHIAWRDRVSVSDYFAKILDKMLKTSVRERYQNASEISRALDLEPHLESLANCMTSRPLTGKNSSTAKANMSPVTRTARSIRSWFQG